MEEKVSLYDIEILDEIMEKNECIIFGAGKVARTIIQYGATRDFRINSILVTKKTGNPPDIMGIPVNAVGSEKADYSNKILLVCVMENLHQDLKKQLLRYGFEKIYFVSNKLYRRVMYKVGNLELDEMFAASKLKEDILYQMQRFVSKPCLEYMILNILDHCNLNCKGCDHFACIAEPYFVPFETLQKDLARMAELFHGDYIMEIAVMGGEPLLHPELLDILAEVRKNFPHAVIRLTTNGLLLLKQGTDFWKTCHENRVTIINTKYPINLDFKKMEETAQEQGVAFQYFRGTGGHAVKTIFKKSINLKGNGKPVENFASCHISNYGNFLMEGKFYGCPFSCQSYRIFNKKFQQDLRMTENDYLDIYKAADMQEVLDFAARPKYYCRYCTGLSPRFAWEKSERDIREWTDE